MCNLRAARQAQTPTVTQHQCRSAAAGGINRADTTANTLVTKRTTGVVTDRRIRGGKTRPHSNIGVLLQPFTVSVRNHAKVWKARNAERERERERGRESEREGEKGREREREK